MTTLLFSLTIIGLTVALFIMAMYIEHLAEETDEIKGKLEFHRIKLQYLDSCNLDHGKRLVHLEKALELKEYSDEEPLTEEAQ